MKIYLVGGAVRDDLLGREVTERDFVVVGATPEALLAQGFRSVGNDFPVFLHPQTQEEFALARTERKIGKGYTGFECFADPTVTLEEDLERRDLTINAMAQVCEFSGLELSTVSKDIIDPFGGQRDLKDKILRHVSPAFSEDPVRILRVARFAARFADFTVHPETNQLMQKMVATGEVNALVPERVWKEFSRTLTEKDPRRFFSVLSECDALSILFPEFKSHATSFEYLQKSVSITAKTKQEHHTVINSPENHTGVLHFGALTLGLNTTEVTTLCQRLRPPSQFSDLALLVAKNLRDFQTLNIKDAEAVINFLEKIDAYRRPSRFFDFCTTANLAFEASGQSGEIAEALYQAFETTKNIDAAPFVKQGLKGEAIGAAIHHARVDKLRS